MPLYHLTPMEPNKDGDRDTVAVLAVKALKTAALQAVDVPSTGSPGRVLLQLPASVRPKTARGWDNRMIENRYVMNQEHLGGSHMHCHSTMATLQRTI